MLVRRMVSAPQLRRQIEAALADRIPSALTPAPRVIRPTAPTGIPALDEALGGGLPLGAISELAGPECSGRTSLALSFLSGLTRAGQVCAWVDVSDTLHPESAAAAGVDLARLLWIRCGPPAEQLTLPGLDEQRHGRSPENISAQSRNRKNESISVTNSSVAQNYAPRCAEPQPTLRKKSREVVPGAPSVGPASSTNSDPCAFRSDAFRSGSLFLRRKSWSRLDQALRAADLLLQAGGFAAIVLDMGSVAPEFALRIPLATWFRYRAAAERSQASILLLTRQACTQSSAGVVLHCDPDCESGVVGSDSRTVLTGAEWCVTIARERFAQASAFTRKPPQSDYSTGNSGNALRWQTRTPWAATRPVCAPKSIHPRKSGRSRHSIP